MGTNDDGKNANDILLEEAQRRVEHQLQRNNEIKSEAATLLRIIFSFVGIFLSVLTILAYLIASGEVSLGFSRFSPPIGRHSESFPYFAKQQWEFIIGLIFIGSVALFMYSIRTFGILINRGFKALSPTNLQTSISPKQINKWRSYDFDDGVVESAVINQLSSHIRNNEKEIDAIRKEWEGSYNSYWRGVRRLLTGIIGYVVLFLNAWYLTLSVLFIYLLMLLLWGADKINDEYINIITDVDLFLDGLSAIFMLIFTAGIVLSNLTQRTWLAGLMLLSGFLTLPIIAWLIYSLELKGHTGFTIRVLFAMVIGFVIYTFVYLGESLEEKLSLASASNIAGYALTALVLIFIISLIVGLFKGAIVLRKKATHIDSIP